MRKTYKWPVEKIRNWIAEGKTQQWIADELGFGSSKLVQKVCKKHGIKCQRTGPRSAEGHPQWGGGRHIDKHGYVLVYAPNHHSVQSKNEQRGKLSEGYFRKAVYVREHRLVMEQYLGRQLLDTEVVHHKNGNRQDNRIENLELYQTNGKHLEDTLAGKCPQWTQAGKEQILRTIYEVAHIRRSHREAGAPLCRQTKIRPLMSRDTSPHIP
jgi:hypothetical protein